MQHTCLGVFVLVGSIACTERIEKDERIATPHTAITSDAGAVDASIVDHDVHEMELVAARFQVEVESDALYQLAKALERADVVLRVNCVGKTARKREPTDPLGSQSLVTDYEFEVVATERGTFDGGPISFTQIGGETTDRVELFCNKPDFVPGEQYLLLRSRGFRGLSTFEVVEVTDDGYQYFSSPLDKVAVDELISAGI